MLLMPKTGHTLFALAILSAVAAVEALPRTVEDVKAPRPRTLLSTSDLPREVLAQRLSVQTATDTFVLGEFSFDSGGAPDAQGWVSVDMWNRNIYFHVAGADELDGGDFGRLYALQGSQSMWCGVVPGPGVDVCNFAALPGYDNNWDQRFISKSFVRTGDVTISYLVAWDSEPAYDQTHVQFKNKDGDWDYLFVGKYQGSYWYDGIGDSLETFVIPDSALGDSIQFRFLFSSDGAWSDRDGLWDTDGAILIDSLTISDETGVLDFQDFEADPAGATQTNDGHWRASTSEPYGNVTGLYSALEFVQEDPCLSRISSLWAFINESAANYACGGFPQQVAVPYARTIDQFVWPREVWVWSEVWSPVMDWSVDIHGTPVPASSSVAILEFDVYRDLPLDALVFYTWSIRGVFSGCPDDWHNDNFVYWSGYPDWFRHRAQVGGHVPVGVDQVQVAVGVRDMCAVWCGMYGSGNCHSHAPLFDNVRLVRIAATGPSWVVEAADLFQDSFSADGTITGTVPMNSARRFYARGNPAASDAAVVRLYTSHGLDYHLPGDPETGFAIYCHVGDVSPAKSGDAISDDPVRWPVVSQAGGWTVLQFAHAGGPGNPVNYIDLNDDLFTPGDTVYYYFSARDTTGGTSYWTLEGGTSSDEMHARATAMEVTCLPANGLDPQNNILYVDAHDRSGAQPLFESAFAMLGLTPDRFDVLDATTAAGNGLGNQVVNPVVQLDGYSTIIWGASTLRHNTIGDGSGDPSRSDDFALLFTFLDQSSNRPGLYISGDHVADEWNSLASPSALDLRNTFLNFNFVGGDHVALGQPLIPRVLGAPGSCFDHGPAGPDTMIAFGGCPSLNDFDVITPYGPARLGMTYSGNASRGAVVMQSTINSVGDTAGVVLSGFSFHGIADDQVASPPDRAEHLLDILAWLGGNVPVPTGDDRPVAYRNALAQNYPNPFNPTTTILFSLAERGRVVLKVFDVSGRLVRTLADATLSAGALHRIEWDGRDEGGVSVASGVYFYRLVTGGFNSTRKMVLLK